MVVLLWRPGAQQSPGFLIPPIHRSFLNVVSFATPTPSSCLPALHLYIHSTTFYTIWFTKDYVFLIKTLDRILQLNGDHLHTSPEFFFSSDLLKSLRHPLPEEYIYFFTTWRNDLKEDLLIKLYASNNLSYLSVLLHSFILSFFHSLTHTLSVKMNLQKDLRLYLWFRWWNTIKN